ncbi:MULTISPECIES: DUF4040 domain-containing protein [unclassified Coleofasciculus]|uniref:DUF4040 domain-containing protein n=1 Tax=unclassified Coleofasciculus TaxID=2692782 RepID=UPI00187FE881|nr:MULTISPECIES: DUF4040 domain-containing protein [unclassified Coleofasciculus]MBE9125440.1 DUF4040 domain-containing protein [Coleofasciculus sp. LEGE 07081]MBE9147126.1 DUF4040 domain-containing protein [Coleofasciculus sp. LEGE 07092]
MTDSYIYVITALLPLSAFMLVVQVNPYHALIIQGILGAVASLVFAVLGAADVALTQALMGTLLAITLYAIAVRSSLVMRLGVLEDGAIKTDDEGYFGELVDDLRTIFGKHYLRLELVPYTDKQALHRALMEKEIHGTCARRQNQDQLVQESENQPYHTQIRVRRLYEIMQAELSSPATILTYINAPDSGEEH